jgi:signal transduction histidine kinase
VRRFKGVHSVRQKLFIGVFVTSFAAVLMTAVALFVFDVRTYREASAADITSLAELNGIASTAALEFDDPQSAHQHLGALRARQSIRAAATYNARGSVFASYLRPDADRSELPALPGTDGVTISGDRISVFHRVVHNNEIVGTVYLTADLGMRKWAVNYAAIALTVTLASLIVALLLSSRLQATLTQPIVEVAELARRVVEKRDYSLRATPTTEDEIGTLVLAFNDMLSEIERRTAELERSTRELDQLNESLERRVRERTAQLEETNRQLESFSYSVSHDLRAPLRAIDGFGHALIQDYGEQVTEGMRSYLDRMRGAARRMGQLIEDLLALSRFSRTQLSWQDIDLSAMAGQILADLAQTDPSRKVEWRVWEGMHARADSRLMRVVLENLIGNAWKFTARVPMAEIEFGVLRDAETSTWFVRDNGAGFDMQYADKLFDAFQRLHSADEFPGSGIGLATVQRIIHRHGGRIWAHGEQGQGATFYFTLGRPDNAGC